MQMLGHRDIRMTLRYVQITQVDLQREYFAARLKAAERYTVPQLSAPTGSPAAGLSGIRQALAATCHMLEMYRRQTDDEKISRKLRRLVRRLSTVDSEIRKLETSEK
jgi:hypothetical protein